MPTSVWNPWEKNIEDLQLDPFADFLKAFKLTHKNDTAMQIKLPHVFIFLAVTLLTAGTLGSQVIGETDVESQ